MTLRQALARRGYTYDSIFGEKAEDIYFASSEKICEALGYILRHVNRIDAEIPDDQYEALCEIFPNYPIRNGYTSGGNKMKRAPQYRIYLNTTQNIPTELFNRLQNDNQMRFTGSLFIESCFFIGFMPGSWQDKNQVRAAVEEVFMSVSEREAFEYGYNL